MYLWISGDSFEQWAGDGENRGKVTLDWTPVLEDDEGLNDSDKTLTVPADTEWWIQSIWVEFISTAAGGNRQIEVQILDGAADVIGEIKVSTVQGASITRYYMLSKHLADLAAFRDTDWLMTPIPDLILPAGFGIRIWDNAAIDAAADDMVCQVMTMQRAVA